MADKIIVEVDLEASSTAGTFKGIQRRANKAGNESGKAFSSGFKSVLGGVLLAEGITSALRGIASEFGKIASATKSLGTIETQFATILGSTKAAQEQLEELQQFAATTPFQLEGLSLATRQLLSFGVAQEQIIPTLRQIGDLAAGTGSQIDELTIPFGRLVSTQKLTLIELDKFADRGINLFGQLSKQTGISLGEIRDAISNGKIPFDEFTTALNTLTSAGGTFFRATQAQSKTLEGVLSTLGDNLFNLRASFGQTFSPAFIVLIEKITSKIQGFSTSLSDITKDTQSLSTNFRSIGQNVIDFVIRPVELLTGFFDVALQGAKFFVSGIVAGFGQIAQKAGELLSFISPDSELAQGLINFGETSANVFEDFTNKADQALTSLFETPITDEFNALNEELAASLETTSERIIASSDKIKTATGETKKELSNLTKAANKLINQQLARTISGGIQTIVNNLAAGKAAFADFGKFILGAFGDLAIQLGEFYIANGLANLALISVDPTTQIATGAALVALGSILKSFSGGGLSGAGASATDGGTAGETAAVGDVEPGTINEERQEQGQAITVNIDQNLDSEQTGETIANIISKAFEKKGTVLTGVRTA